MESEPENTSPAQPLFNGLFSAIVPCRDEREMLPVFYAEFLKTVESMGNPDFELIFVEDGSTDGSLGVIREISEADPRVRYISFSRNFGKEAAMYAGLKAARGDYATIMDADLQDPPNLLPEMFRAIIEDGFDSVAARRKTRDGEPLARSFFARAFYKVLNVISPMKFTEGARDFRLMTREVLNAVLSLPEYNRFTKGIYEWVGFKTKWIEYENVERPAGKTKWSFWSLAVYSVDAMTSFSAVPLAIAAVVGILFCILSSAAIVVLSVRQLIWHNSAYGWTSMICAIFFLSGLQLFCLGVLGQYMSKIYLETKNRPNYIIRETSD